MPVKKLDHVNFVTADMSATIAFYQDIIGLRRGKQMSAAASGTEYFYIGEEKRSILHITDAHSPKNQPSFKRYAETAENNKGNFSTGSFDHFCLLMDLNDYEEMLTKIKKHNLTHDVYCHENSPIKQIWVLDPNGVRVELSFSP
jgi:catechol 2,3-dioxygenase-like lactoylglutathione lyase family enzyme